MPKHLIRLHGLGEPQSRRRFLANISFGFSGVIGLALTVPLIGYIFGPLIKRGENTWQSVGQIGDFPVGQTVLAKLQDASSVPWAGLTAVTAVWVRQLTAGNFQVFAVNCTHLGCPVSWLSEAQLFECPCHGGIYYANGDVAAGPPPHALFQHQVRVQDGQVQVLTFPIPTAR
jgi:quinol---cytochrome c reductase iron-sulfur subunit, bacillus type